MIYETLFSELQGALKDLGFFVKDKNILSIPESSKFGHYSSNIPLQLAKQLPKHGYHSPREIANAILEKMHKLPFLERVEIAGAGFINFYLKDEAIFKALGFPLKKESKKLPQRYLIEYGQPNTHKEFHIGHVRNLTTGESLARLLEFDGHEVFRVTYDGDIGPHVAKALWAILQNPTDYESVKEKSLFERAKFLGQVYVKGSQSYQDNPKAKEEIDDINQRLYKRDPQLLPLWTETKQWSLAYFDCVYSQFGTEFDRVIVESEVEAEGVEIVKNNLNKVFIKDQGAVIFPGEQYGLHNRVFITGKGYPTYEAKELGLTQLEMESFPFDSSLHVVANEQSSYFEVVIKALELIDKRLIGKKKHLSYGMVNLSTGKMSSRQGNVVTVSDLVQRVSNEVAKVTKEGGLPSKEQLIEKVAVGAIKFFMLKQNLSTDIYFDVERSVSLHGDSGPYIQYTHARIQSLLEKSAQKEIVVGKNLNLTFQKEEQELLRQLEHFRFMTDQAALELKPSIICEYLLGLAKAFNLFYQSCPVLGSEHEVTRLALVAKTGEALKLGLFLLGIEAPERM